MTRVVSYGLTLLFVLLAGITYAGGESPQRNTSRDSAVVLRLPEAGFIEQYREDPDFDYVTPFRKSPDLLDSFIRWLRRNLLGEELSEETIRLLSYGFYAVLILILFWGIYRFIREKRRIVIRKTEELLFADTIADITVQNEDSYSLLISQAEAAGNYSVAVRILFSELLYRMNQAGWIKWGANKTNRNYYYEIKSPEVKEKFSALSLIFEYVCYGEFMVDRGMYTKITAQFEELRREVER